MPRAARRRVGNLLALAASALLSILLAALLLRGYEALLGADIPYGYFVEPRPVLWQPDPEIGFRNRESLTHRIFGGLVSHTNDVGFRAWGETSEHRTPGSLRVIGVGDSVMWGSRVNQEDSFLGVLETELAAALPGLEVEVINAGVVGYSTYQERLLFEARVVPYAPDLVLVNFCVNDYLPTEDPFQNVREVYVRYLQSLEVPDPPGVEAMESILESPHAWGALDRALRSPRTQQSLRELLIDRPIAEMAQIAGRRDIRLVYLLIPVTFEKPRDRVLRLQMRRVLEESGIEYIDFSEALREDKTVYGRQRPFEEGFAHRLVGGSGVRDLVVALSLGALDPLRSLRNISRLRGIATAHERRNFIDHIGHPSRRGHRIIAEGILRYLSSHPEARRPGESSKHSSSGTQR
jgi:lysophospholipase L1-like esterase